MQAVGEAGIAFKVARVWYNVTGRFERRVHNMQKNLLCPLCLDQRKIRPARPRLADYREIEDPYPENLEYDGHWEYQPLALRTAWQKHPSESLVLGELGPELLGEDGLLAPGLDPESEDDEREAED
jgi:hypothetical protein